MISAAVLALESLENRLVPSANLNAFARFHSTDFPGQESLPVRVGASNFPTPNRTAIVCLVFRSELEGSVRAVSAINGSTRTIAAKAGLPGAETGGLTLVVLRPQAYSFKLPELPPGANWTLEACLAGDANGDFRVDSADLQSISSRLGKSFGQPGYSREADANGDGVISSSDARLAQSNLGASTTVRPLNLSAKLSSASDPDQNGVVVRRQATVVCSATPGTALSVVMEGQRNRGFTAGPTGIVSFATTLPAGTSTCRISATGAFGQRATARHDITVGDAILAWNRTHLNAIKDYRHASLTGVGLNVLTPPPLAARNLAIMHLAMNEAIESVEATVLDSGKAAALANSAASAAAQSVLKALYPIRQHTARFDATLAECLAGIASGIRAQGLAIGRAAAVSWLSNRAGDGWAEAINYPPGDQPGEWVPTPAGFKSPLLPQWPSVTPFVMSSPDEALPPPPPDPGSDEYAAAFNEVKALGSKSDSSRTADQTAIALFWADGGGTVTPPGHWNLIAADLAGAAGNTLSWNAKLFATLNAALADAGIACWKAKYRYAMWRPVTAINRASEDDNDATEEDTAWRPLLETPPFPTYTSGHSTFSGAAATVLAGYFGDATQITVRADTPSDQVTALADRSFASFSEAATEASWSRIYGGIHFRFDGEAGLEAGRVIGELALEHTW